MEYFQDVLKALQTIAENVGRTSAGEWFLAGFAAFAAIVSWRALHLNKQVADKAAKIAEDVNKIFVKQTELEEQKDKRHEWEHRYKYVPWLLIKFDEEDEIKKGIKVDLEYQVNKGPFFWIENETNGTARIFKYIINDVDLSEVESKAGFHISRNHPKRQYPQMKDRMEKKDYEEKISDVKKTFANKKKPQAVVKITYKDMGSGIYYKRQFYFNYYKDENKLSSMTRNTYDPPEKE